MTSPVPSSAGGPCTLRGGKARPILRGLSVFPHEGRRLPWNWALKPLRRWLPSEVKCRRSQFLLLMTGDGRFMPVSLEERERPRVNQQGKRPTSPPHPTPCPGCAWLLRCTCSLDPPGTASLATCTGVCPVEEGSHRHLTWWCSFMSDTGARKLSATSYCFHQNLNVMGSKREKQTNDGMTLSLFEPLARVSPEET